MKRAIALLVLLVAGAIGAVWWQTRPSAPPAWQGYVDAEYVRISPMLTGRIVTLSVERGTRVAAGAPLFRQDDEDDRGARDAAAGKLMEAEARLTNVESASRDTEIAQARSELVALISTRDRIARDLARNEDLLRTGAASRQIVEQQRAELATASAQAEAASAKLDQMRAPTGRAFEIAAQRAMVTQARAALEQAKWKLEQRHVAAPETALVADTFARPGEIIAAGTPVLSLLPPRNVLVRFFVPETSLAAFRVGQRVTIGCDGCPAGMTAAVSFIAPQPEYTPPVIYSESNRSKLVYLIEARPPPDLATRLSPGQPVDVRPVDVRPAADAGGG